jgi:glycosyltransferase involved in cell wall biosynthesis
MRKKKIVIQTDWCLSKTGFGRAAKELLSYLHNTGKYEVVHYCCGIQNGNPLLRKTPWKSIGSVPTDQNEVNRINADPSLARDVSYGSYYIDEIIKTEKPDIWIGAQDPWAFGQYYNKKWYKNITSLLWVTLDSLPIYDEALNQAKNSSQYWIWSDFATKELHKVNINNAKTVHGPVNYSNFEALSALKKKELRDKYGLQNSFIVGFVFRNQLRKSVPNLIEGFRDFTKNNPSVKNAKLLLHTHWSEGWDIFKLADEYKVSREDILTTYICNKCKNYFISSFKGQEVKCGVCNTEKSCSTTNTNCGVSEKQLCEIYNLMDVYCHPFTSGGQEIPIQEAKYCELITLVTNYSCGEDMCVPEAASLTLEWSEYREHGTQFRKASTYPSSIAKQLLKVYNMPDSDRKEMGRKARKWALENYSVEVIGKIFEEYLDSIPFTSYDFSLKEEEKNPNAVIPDISDNSKWLIYLYHHILKMTSVDEKDEGHKHWMKALAEGKTRKDIEAYFRQVATEENKKNQKIDFEDILGKDDKGKRLLFIMPESIGDVFLSTSLLPSIKETYPEYNIYFATKRENFAILEANPYIYKIVEYIPQMDNLLWLEGYGNHQGYFEIAFLPYIGTQKMLNYIHNGKDKITFDLK